MLNNISIMGRLTAEVELRHTQSGKSVASFTIANNRSIGEGTDFLDVVAWGKTGEFCEKYFHKGQLIIINGRLQTRTYEDKNGNKRKAVEIIANTVDFGGDKPQQSEPTQFNVLQAQQTQAQENTFAEIDSEEDLPF